MVRAKFRCNSIEHENYGGTERKTVRMSPVFGNGDPSHENTKFWSASPNGLIEIRCANPAAAEAFVPGKEYYVDFTPAS